MFNKDRLQHCALSHLIRVMKLTTFFLLVTFITVNAGVYSQTAKLDFKVQSTTVKDVLSIIENQSDFFFMYNDRKIDVNRKIDIDFKGANIEMVLNKIFEGTDTKYVIKNRQIVLYNQNEVGDLSGNSLINTQQQKTVSGKVADATGGGLPGVAVVVKGTTKGTITDVDGNYNLANIPANSTLVFSFVGMKTLEIAVGNKGTINASLVEESIGLDEVVAVGYGTQKKSDVVSSVTSIKAVDLIKTPTSDVGEMLRGRATGVQITASNASPGSNSSIEIRGKRSINGGNDPLVIADGVQVSSINDVNPYDIASMEILKDAAAQAIYGARASNGVILITTKRGESGKTIVDYNAYYGAQALQKHFDVYSGEEYANYRREAFRTDNNDKYLSDNVIFSPDELESINKGQYIDWMKEITRIASVTNHNVSLTTGTDRTKVFSAVSYLNQEGIVKGSNYDKTLIRLNVDHKINNWVKVGINTSWQLANKDYPGESEGSTPGSMLQRAVITSPLGKIYNSDGSFKLHPGDVQDSFNPLMDLNEVTNLTKERKDLMNIFMDISPIKGLNYRLNASRNSANQNLTNYYSAKSTLGVIAGGKGFGKITYNENIQWQLENILTYDFKFKDDKNKLNLLFIQSIVKNEASNFINKSTNFPNDVIGIYGLSAAEFNQPFISGYERTLSSFGARIQYDYLKKYFITASLRADGSSVFGENNKWGYFPAVAAGWNVYKEDFLKDSKTVNNLKLRLSYGSVGNEGISPYQSLNTAVKLDYMFAGAKTLGLSPSEYLANPDLRWETSTTFNTALDFGLFSNRLSGNIEFYNTRTRDLLVDRALNAVTGYSMMKTNIGNIENQGLEISLNGDIIRKRDFTLKAGISFNTNRNKILSLYGTDANGDGVEDDDIANNWFVGHPIDVYYQYKPIGIWQTTDDIAHSNTPGSKPGDVKLWDKDPTDGALNASDRVITKQDPDWYGAFTIDMTYKGFDMSANLYTVQGRVTDNVYLRMYQYGGAARGILSGIKRNYWTPENTSGTSVRPRESNNPPFTDFTGLQDASFIRLQNLTLGYTIPKRTLESLKLSKLRFYVTGQNLFTITKFQSFSPENNESGTTSSFYPDAVSVVGGIQIGF